VSSSARFWHARPGRYTLRVQAPGHVVHERIVELTESGPNDLEIELKKR
jgi:hypothetical protein